jgi:hypothetical protein
MPVQTNDGLGKGLSELAVVIDAVMSLLAPAAAYVTPLTGPDRFGWTVTFKGDPTDVVVEPGSQEGISNTVLELMLQYSVAMLCQGIQAGHYNQDEPWGTVGGDISRAWNSLCNPRGANEELILIVGHSLQRIVTGLTLALGLSVDEEPVMFTLVDKAALEVRKAEVRFQLDFSRVYPNCVEFALTTVMSHLVGFFSEARSGQELSELGIQLARLIRSIQPDAAPSDDTATTDVPKANATTQAGEAGNAGKVANAAKAVTRSTLFQPPLKNSSQNSKPSMCARLDSSKPTHIYYVRHNTQQKLALNFLDKLDIFTEVEVGDDDTASIKIIRNALLDGKTTGKLKCDRRIVVFAKSSYVNLEAPLKTVNLATPLTAALNSFKSDKGGYNNVTIIHETNSFKHIVPKITYTNNMNITLPAFLKIINVIPLHETLYHYASTKAFNTVKHSVEEYFDDQGTDELEPNTMFGWTVRQPTAKQPNTTTTPSTPPQRYVYVVKDTRNNKDDPLSDQWWYKYYFSVPPCATGRLKQFTATCWFNAALNVLLLTPPMANLLLKEFIKWYTPQSDEQKKQFDDQSSFAACPSGTLELSTLLRIVIYNILFKGVKATMSNSNFITELAARTKSIAILKGETTYQTYAKTATDYADYHNSFDAIRIILEKMLPSNALMCYNMDAVIPKFDSTYDSYFLSGSAQVIVINSYNGSGFNTADPKIGAYSLVCATLYVDEKHIVAGLMCGDVPYIYDSYDYIAQCDWPKGDTGAYLEVLRVNGETGYGETVNGMLCLVYMNDDREGGEQ